MPELPKVMQDELAACSRTDCRIQEARGEIGNNIISHSSFLECKSCSQIWELICEGGHFTHWDKAGHPHITAQSYTIGSKWPKGESQCESALGGLAMKKRFVDAKR